MKPIRGKPGEYALNISLERRLLDNAVFDALGLTAGERDAVYEGVAALVAGGWRGRGEGEGMESKISKKPRINVLASF